MSLVASDDQSKPVSRFFRFSLAQALLLLALVAFVFAVATDIWRHHFHVTSNHPSLEVSPDGSLLAMNVSHRPLFHGVHPVMVSDLRRPASPIKELHSHEWLVSDVAWFPDGRTLVSCSGDGSIRFWDVSTGDELRRIGTGSHRPNCLAISPDAKYVATGGGSLVKVWDVQGQNTVATLKGHNRLAWAVAFSPDGKYLASACIDSQLKIWDTATWNVVTTAKLTTATRHLAFTPDGRLLTGGYKAKSGSRPWQCNVSVYAVPSARILEEIPIAHTWAAVSAVSLSANGEYLAAAHGGDRNLAHSAVTIWNLSDLKELKTLEIPEHDDNWIDELAFSADGETLFCASGNGKVTAQTWRSGESKIVSKRRDLPWKFVVAFTSLWLTAWFYLLRHQRAKRARLLRSTSNPALAKMRSGLTPQAATTKV